MQRLDCKSVCCASFSATANLNLPPITSSPASPLGLPPRLPSPPATALLLLCHRQSFGWSTQPKQNQEATIFGEREEATKEGTHFSNFSDLFLLLNRLPKTPNQPPRWTPTHSRNTPSLSNLHFIDRITATTELADHLLRRRPTSPKGTFPLQTP